MFEQNRNGEIIRSLAVDLRLARRRTDRLFACVPRELLYVRPIAERHRIAFYMGHLEAFDANLLLGAGGAADRLFAFGIDPVGTGLPSDTPDDWPDIAAIHRYAEDARHRVDRRLEETPEFAGGVPLATLLHTAVEHRLMHAETLAYMFNRLPVEKKLRAVPATEREFSDDDMVAIPEGTATLGMSGDAFGWDNEFHAHAIDVPAFAIDRHMVTNGQFRRFIDAGGYANARWWKADDWQWREANRILHPASWQRADDDWQIISLFDAVPFQGDWPVHVSHAEAGAYAHWAGKRLPGEAQWHRAAYGTPGGAQRAYPWGDAAPDETHGNFDFRSWDPMPADAHPAGASAFGVAGLTGNGWEWTSTQFAPFSGFQPFSFYKGYSMDFFDDRHFVLKGGSAHTAAPLLRRSFRNWFQPHYPYAFAGFRCVSAP